MNLLKLCSRYSKSRKILIYIVLFKELLVKACYYFVKMFINLMLCWITVKKVLKLGVFLSSLTLIYKILMKANQILWFPKLKHLRIK